MARDFDDNRHKRDPEKGWSRDDKGRLFRLEAGARTYKTVDDRDAALEELYTDVGERLGAAGIRDILAFVVEHHEDLVVEYMRWCLDRHAQEVYDSETLAQWEREKFGARLYVAGHKVLLYRVKVARFGDPYRRLKPQAQQPNLLPGVTNAERLEQMHVALAANVEGKTMRDGVSGEEWDRHQQELLHQRQEIGG